jgi:lipid-binding SYLF domain-containing protein
MMKTSLITLLLVVATVTLFSQENDVDEANEAISNFKKTNSEIEKFFNSAYGYAVFPGIGKGGLGVGGAAGKGVVYQGGAPVADTKMSQLTIGLQAGGQKYAEIIFFEDERAYTRFVANKFEFAAQVSAVALK